MIYLLRVNDEEKSHYIYIQHIDRLLNLHTHIEDKDKRFCPMCNGKIKICDYSKHVHECYKFACEGSLLKKLPPKGSTMKFMNYREKMERPYMFYADMESTLVKYNDETFHNQDKNTKKQCTTNRTHKHVVNSCSFVCRLYF